MKLLAEITFMLRNGKMKGKVEESKGWNLPNNLHIEGIYSTMFVVLKTSVVPSLFSYSYLTRIGNLPLSWSTCGNNMCIRFCSKFSTTENPAKFLLGVFQDHVLLSLLENVFLWKQNEKIWIGNLSYNVHFMSSYDALIFYLQMYFSKAFQVK